MSKRRLRKRYVSPDQLVSAKAQQLFNPYAPISVLSEEDLDLIHDGAMRILEEIGLHVMNEKALSLYEASHRIRQLSTMNTRFGNAFSASFGFICHFQADVGQQSQQLNYMVIL